jgi:hypothetical protein
MMKSHIGQISMSNRFTGVPFWAIQCIVYIRYFCLAICDTATADFPLPLNLFNSSNPGAPLVQDFGTFWDIGFNDLIAGNYITQATFEGFDPPFTISIIDPTTGGPQAVGAPIPEPATLALLTLGLVGLGFSRRKQ